MASITVGEAFLEKLIELMLNDKIEVGNDRDLMECLSQLDGSPIDMANTLKQSGNEMFRENLYPAAASCYDKALKILCFISKELFDLESESFCALASSLILNFAACALKLHDPSKARNLCSFVLSYFPDNAKALYRRASALIVLRRFVKAKSDLSKAAVIDPKNKDILRQLSAVEEQLVLNSNGKRSIDATASTAETRVTKKVVCVDKTGSCVESCMINSRCSDLETSLGRLPVSSGCCLETSSHSKGIVKDNDVPFKSSSSNVGITPSVEVSHQDANKRILVFSKKGRENAHLRLHVHTYEKLLQGKEVSYHSISKYSSIRIRILNKCVDMEMKCDAVPEKRRSRRRRRRRPRKSNSKPMKTKTTPGVLSSSFHNVTEVVSTMSTTITSCITSSTNNQIATDQQQPFKFAAAKFCRRTIKVKRWTAMDCNQAMSPTEHISPPFPSPMILGADSKFLRSRNVSVFRSELASCSWKLKKRKNSPVRLVPDVPLKKPLFEFSLCSSFTSTSLISVKIINPGSESQETSMS